MDFHSQSQEESQPFPAMNVSRSLPIQQRREPPNLQMASQSDRLTRVEPTDSDFFNLTAEENEHINVR